MAKTHANPTTQATQRNYGHLNRVQDDATRNALKVIMDRLGVLEDKSAGIGTLTASLTDDLNAAGNKLTEVADPTADTDGVNLKTLKSYVEAAIGANNAATSPSGNPSPVPPPSGGGGATPPPTGICYTSIAGGQPTPIPGADIRWFRGDFCGIDVPGLPFVTDGSSENPSLLLTPYIDRYSAANQNLAFTAYGQRGYTHWLLWWPNSRDAWTQSVAQFTATCQLIRSKGYWPVVSLYSKVYDGQNPDPTKNDALIASLNATLGSQWVCCIGFELDEFFDAGAALQAAIDHICPQTTAFNVYNYVHFSEGLTSWQGPTDPGGGGAWWTLQKGKLRGIFHQKNNGWDCPVWQSKLNDLQIRFGSGAAGWPSDSGFGGPFDIVACEYSASARFPNAISESTAQGMGQEAIATPGPGGSLPPLGVRGFLNGGPGLGRGT